MIKRNLYHDCLSLHRAKEADTTLNLYQSESSNTGYSSTNNNSLGPEREREMLHSLTMYMMEALNIVDTAPNE